MLICRPSQRKREREKEEKFCVLWAKEIIFFQKREKTDSDGQKGDKRAEKEKNIASDKSHAFIYTLIMTTTVVCHVPSSSIVGSALGGKSSLVVTAENDGVLLHKTSLSSLKDVNDDEKVNTFFRSWRASRDENVKFAHPCVYDGITRTYFGCTTTKTTTKTTTTKKRGGGARGQVTTILSWRDDRENYHASIDDAAAGGKTSFENKTAKFFASFDGGCVVVDGEKGDLHVVDSDGAIVGTVEAKDVDDDEEEEEEEEEEETTTRTRTKNKKSETVKRSVAVEAANGNAESDDVIVVLASMMGEEVVKREVLRYRVKELDVQEDQLGEENIVDQTLLSGRKLMERVSKEKAVRVNLDESDAMAEISTMKSSKVVKVSFDDEHFSLLWSNGVWTSHDLGDGTLVRERVFDGLQIKREEEEEEEASRKKTTKKKVAVTQESDGLLFDYISIGGGYYALAAKIKSEGKNSANNNVAVAIIDKLYGVIHSFIEIPDSETTSVVSLTAFGGDLYVSLSDRIYSVSLELEELCLRECMAALQKDVFGKARNKKAEAAERAFSTSGFEAATKPQCKAITVPIWKDLPPERNFEGACNDINMLWDQDKMRKQEKVAEDFIATLESGTEKQMLRSLEIFANKHVKEAIKWIDENEQKTKEALRLKRTGQGGGASAAASSKKTKKLEGNGDSGGSDYDDTDDYDSDNSEEKVDKIKNAVYYGMNDPTSNNIRTGAVIAPHCVDAAIKAAWTLKKWDYLSEAFSRGLLLGGAMSSIGLIEKLLEDDRLIDAVNVCIFAWWVNPEDLRRIVDACMSAKKNNTSSPVLNFHALHDKNRKSAFRKVKLCEKLARDKRDGPKKKGTSKQQQFYEELELRAALDDCRIWTFAVENFGAWAQPMHTIVARSMFHREDSSMTLKNLSNEDAVEFLSFLVDWVEFHVITLKGEFNAKKDSADEENADDAKNDEESSRLDPDDEVNFDFAKKYKGTFPSLEQSIEWSSALLDVRLPAFSGNARAIEKMERLRELATRQFETNASIANLSGALEHVRIGADIPEGLGVTSATYTIEKVNW